MTNKEWLDYLAHNAPDELAAWFDAEHTESPTSETMQQIGQVIESTVKRGVYGDTESENADSRDKIEADVRDTVPEWHVDKVVGWLDRQAAITEEQTRCKWVTASAEEIAAWSSKAEKLKEQVYELTAERDNWEANCEDWKKDCERYRELFGKCLDYADAIHALMDEVMA